MKIVDPIFPLRGVQSSHFKFLVASLHALEFNYGNETTTVTWSAECNPTYLSTEDPVADESGQRVLKEGLEMILLDERHRCSAVR